MLHLGVVNPQWGVLDLHTDHLGTVRMISDFYGRMVSKHDYFPFGEEISPQSSFNTHRFTGHEHDQETGLDYMLARYYEAGVGRFVSVDPALNVASRRNDPGKLNLFAYAANNPLKYTDPNGKAAQDFFRLQYIGYNIMYKIQVAMDKAEHVARKVGKVSDVATGGCLVAAVVQPEAAPAFLTGAAISSTVGTIADGVAFALNPGSASNAAAFGADMLGQAGVVAATAVIAKEAVSEVGSAAAKGVVEAAGQATETATEPVIEKTLQPDTPEPN
jgi:RHS repeat-associated protein